MASVADVYYNPRRGYLVVPVVARADLRATTSLYPAQVLDADADVEDVGLAVLNALRRSEHARPQMLSQADRFWVAMGAESYQDFCHDFVGVTVERRGYRLWLAPLVRDGEHGGYLLAVDRSREVFRYVSAGELGDAVGGMLEDTSPAVEVRRDVRFVALDGAEVSFSVPAVGLVDRGDAGTDFYRVFCLRDEPCDWIGFLIGERYDAPTAAGIRKRWEGEYGSLSSFSCEEHTEDGFLDVAAVTPELEVAARVWPSDRGWTEVRYEIAYGKAHVSQAERARRVFCEVIDSCVVRLPPQA